MSSSTSRRRQGGGGVKEAGKGAGSNNKSNGTAANKRKNRRNENRETEDTNLPESERLPLQQLVTDFLSNSDDELVLPGLSKPHRKYLHAYVAGIGLKSVSHGRANNRVLHIRRRERITSLGTARPLALPEETRSVLRNLLPSLRSHLLDANNMKTPTTQPARNLRGEALSLALGPRMIPPRPQRISSELYRDKQELPIYRYQSEILKMIKQHSVFIINGETGSGKTTQVPQYILNDAARRNRPCRIIVTQPRRVAAVSVSHRVAEERGEALGDAVGYQIRMESRVRKTTNLIYTTSGCLLRSIMADVRDLFRKVTHLIIDEIHERDKNSDFTLITIKEQLKRNKDLKVILMSATMDIQLLSKYFDDCPVLYVPGQGYDVKIYHLEDILYHTGYRTALMEKYLRSMNDMQPNQFQQQPLLSQSGNQEALLNVGPVRLNDDYLQQLLDSILEQCCQLERTEDELCDMFDQIQYYIESEGMPVDAGHTNSGLTPLMAACKCNVPKYVELFLQHQANVYVRDGHGYAAIDYAAMHADGVCVQLIENRGNQLLQQQQLQLSQQDSEKQRILTAYQQQFNDDYEVDHDLILSLLEGLYRSSHPGAIMVFLPGYNDIVQQKDLIQSTLPSGTYRICILHGQMNSQDQFEALQRQRVRKIILSTNIGQTSITIPDLAYIIDSGKVKMKTYDSITESSQLQSVWISQADANQRSGRAGRTQNGVCYRLYSLAKFQFMPKFEIPEFMRIPLTEICLYAKTLDQHCDVQTYLARALNPPSTISVQSAIRKLKILGVFKEDESVTELGRHLVDIPLDVQLGKCLLYGVFLKCFDPVLTICAFHSVKDPFVLPTDRAAQGQASFQRKSFAGESFSDQMGILALYSGYMAVRNNRKRVRDFCAKYYLSHSAMEMFCATRRQIADLMLQKFRVGNQGTIFNDDWHMVRLCLVAGFYPNVALVDRRKNTLRCGAEKQLVLQRTSALTPPGKKHLKEFVHQLPNDWIVFYEKSRVAHTCSINMNTVVPPLLVVLQCGRDCCIEEEEEEDEEDEEAEAEAGDKDGEREEEGDDCGDDDKSGESDVASEVSLAVDERKSESDLEASRCRLIETLDAISLTDDNRKAVMSLDNWIKFELPATDAKMLLLLRTTLQTQFSAFLQHKQQTSSVAFYIQKLLQSSSDTPKAAV